MEENNFNDMKKKNTDEKGNWIKVGLSTCGIAAGAKDVFDTLVFEKEKKNLNIEIKRCGCAGMCYAEPLVEVFIEGMPRVIYGRVDKSAAIEIINRHVCSKELVNDHIYDIKEK